MDFSITIEEMNLSVRTYNLLKRAGINTLDEIVSCMQKDFGTLGTIGGMNQGRLLQICMEVQQFGVPVNEYLNKWIKNRTWFISVDKTFWFGVLCSLEGNISHEKVINMLQTLADFIRQGIPTFKIEDSLKKFDVMMSIFMLKAAASDDNLTSGRTLFIRNVCNHADVFEWIKQNAPTVNSSWLSFELLGKEMRKQVINLLEELAKPLAESFSAPYALVDVVFDREDVHSKILNGISEMMAAFLAIDSNDDFSEKLSAAMSMQIFDKAWKKAKGMAEALKK